MDKTRWGRFFTLLLKEEGKTIDRDFAFVTLVVVITIAVVLWGRGGFQPLGVEGLRGCAGLMVILIFAGAGLWAAWSAFRSVRSIWQASGEEQHGE